MSYGTRDELWAMYELIFGPLPSPVVDPEDENAWGEFITIPTGEADADD